MVGTKVSALPSVNYFENADILLHSLKPAPTCLLLGVSKDITVLPSEKSVFSKSKPHNFHILLINTN